MLDVPEPPLANVEAEAMLLGALMQGPQLIEPLSCRVNVEDFHEPLFGRVYAAILDLHAKGLKPNPVTLRPLFENDPAMIDLGGTGYLSDLTGSGAAMLGARDFADQVAELAKRRRLDLALNEARATLCDYGKPIEEAAEQADQALAAARDGGDSLGEYSGAEALKLVIDAWDQPVTGVRQRVVPSLSDLLGPLRPSHLVIGAGRPGMGKTLAAMSFALGAAAEGHGVLFATLEMDAEQLAERLAADMCFRAQVPYEAIRDRTLTADQKREVCRAMERLEQMPLQILDRSGLTISQLRAAVRRWKRAFAARGQKLELVVVDYLQLMGGKSKDGRFGLVTEISRGLKEIAKSEGLAVLALSQLSRDVEKREDKRPMLSDLRESGQIEQDADAVLFLYRPQYYLSTLR